jgi:transposase
VNLLPRNTQNTPVFIAVGATDMRKSINGLSLLVEEHFALDVFSGHLFAFCNRRRDIVKILFWDRNGFCLWHKRLEKDKFSWPHSEEEVVNISGQQLLWLLAGLDIGDAHKRLYYQKVS